MQQINEKITRWLTNTWKPTFFQLGLTRIIYCLGFFVVGLPQFIEISNLELVFFDPPVGISKLIGPITSPEFWWIFDLVLRVIFVLVLVGFRTKETSIIFGLLLIFGFTYSFSYGKIDHDIFAVIFPIIMSFSNWGGALSIDALRKKNNKIKPNGWPLTYLSFLLGWGYFTAGLPKLIGGWLDVSNSSTVGFILRKYYSGEEPLYLNEMFAKINNLFFYKLLDYSTLLFELGFIFTIFWSAVFLRAIGIAAIFHLGVLLTLNISFSLHVLVFLPYLSYYYFQPKTQLSENLELFLRQNKKIFLTIGFLLAVVIIAGYYPESFRFIRTHSVLFLICIPSIFLVLPKSALLFLGKITNRFFPAK
ncbi:restriction endonuclease subunit S [Cyclobacterium jeungdonense]|uniref:Restriction endonuclease subunit S n=1 Tax=Cyclobacterium jeungdonense TaxID=708087 RepID=A0ABT8C4E2_9BACT|nr:restriction endonuclease subunit S [Cyclobacterium jeungdonense]MDN3686610.1 restriction endonuclease subunit S [Cyclobacterium jeungdonense]